MSENLLYFIPVIARALQGSDVEKALREAFCRIERMGTEKRYAEGFENFEIFMDQAYDQHKIAVTDNIRELMAQLGAGMFEDLPREKEILLDIITSHPKLQADFETICHMGSDENLTGESPVIEVSSDKGCVLEKTFEKVPGHESFDGLLPGTYKIKLVNTGWTIWEGRLTAKELIWPEGENLLMAAETGDAHTKSTSRKVLLDGDMILCTYAGIESGSIEIELTQTGGN